MASPASELERAVLAFRREHGARYLKQLAGHEPDPRTDFRAQRWLGSESALERLEQAHANGELEPAVYAAVCAHLGRAVLERAYGPGRTLVSRIGEREVAVEGDTRAVAALLGEWRGQTSVAQRSRLLTALEPALSAFTRELLQVRARADGEVSALFARLRPPRHADAGPEAGSTALAEEWLTRTEDLTREALSFTRTALRYQGESGADALFQVCGQEFAGLFPRDGRMRRLALDWEPLGLRRMLSARARAAVEHPGPLPSPHLVVLAAPEDIRVSASAVEYGLASELASAETVGRALGLAHASSALPLALRFPSVGTVARSIGALATQRLLEPHFLRRLRGLSGRESDVVARVACAFFLLDSRLSAASVLLRTLGPEAPIERAGEVVERALLGPISPGIGAALVVRIAPGGPLRAKIHAPALAWALRERFDGDWYLNPRTGEPLRGALARAGELAIETFASELSTEVTRGIEKLAELF